MARIETVRNVLNAEVPRVKAEYEEVGATVTVTDNGNGTSDVVATFLDGATANIHASAAQAHASAAQAHASAARAHASAAQAHASGAAFNPQDAFTFGSLIPDGFFSANPNDLKVPRSIRTNNPGALNFSAWQKRRLGYVGITQPDNSPDHNVTTIYRTPEHGIAAWYHLLARLYDFPDGRFNLNDLAARYAGGGNTAAIHEFVAGWSKWFHPSKAHNIQFAISDTTAMLILAKAMFSHEAGVATPVHENQITFAIEREQAGTLPA